MILFPNFIKIRSVTCTLFHDLHSSLPGEKGPAFCFISLLKKAVCSIWCPYAKILLSFLHFFWMWTSEGLQLICSCTFLVLVVNQKWHYILLDSNLNKCLCMLKLAPPQVRYKWGLAVYGILHDIWSIKFFEVILTD